MTSQQAASPSRGGTREDISVVAEDVVRRFGDRIVLDHLRLEILASQFVVLLGPSGCGKTTLLRLLGGLDQPDGGTVTVPRTRAIVFQGARLVPWQRVWRNVTIGLYGKDAKRTALSVLDEAGLSAQAGAWPKTLSGGEEQVRAPMSDPALVLLDEPFAALDAITRLRMHDLVRVLHHRHHATMLLVTHDVDEAIALADRILIMRDGRIGSDHRVELGSQDRSRGPAREELRANLLIEIGVASGE
jgi:sulfonate transport system ATP-binding protein